METMPMLRIAEIFTSIQGEGTWLGMPSTFVRVSGCNLRCRWCDTPYASWQAEGPTLEVEAILADVRAREVRHVVLTGGEPMLFDAIEPLCQGLREGGHLITIETAGTCFREVPCDLMSISPKLANSRPDAGKAGAAWVERHERTRIDLEPIRRLVAGYRHQLKFVVDPDSDLDEQLAEIDGIVRDTKASDDDVLLMAEGTDSATLHRKGRALVGVCLERGYRLCPRFHVDLFGNCRGT